MSIRITEGALRRIVRQEARRLLEGATAGRPVMWGVADWLVGRRLAPTGGDQGLSPDGRDVVRVPPGEPCQVVGVPEGRGHAAGARERLLLRLGDGTELVIPVHAVVGKWDFLD